MSTKYIKKVTKTIAHETGEELLTEVEFFKHQESEPSYVKLYLQDVGRLAGLQPRSLEILLELLKNVNYSNEISVPLGKKKEMCRLFGIYQKGTEEENPNVINQHLTHLVNAKLIFKKDMGLYIANPKIFGKGKWQDVKKIVLQVSYSKNGREITTDIKKQNTDG